MPVLSRTNSTYKSVAKAFLNHTVHDIYHFQEEKTNRKTPQEKPTVKDIRNWKQEKASPAAAHTREGSESSCQSRSGSVPAGALGADSGFRLEPPAAGSLRLRDITAPPAFLPRHPSASSARGRHPAGLPLAFPRADSQQPRGALPRTSRPARPHACSRL